MNHQTNKQQILTLRADVVEASVRPDVGPKRRGAHG
jgi:hypothetical protein